MKNIYFMASLATLLLAGCSKDDGSYKFENSETGAKAVFNATIQSPGEILSRAIDQTWTEEDSIGITCIDRNLPDYDQKNFKYLVKQGKIVAADNLKEVWFLGNNNYEVTAYYPYAGTPGAVPKSIADTTSSKKQMPVNQPKLDYLFASATASQQNPNVNLQFSHRMSRLVVQFKSVQSEDGVDLVDLGSISCYLMNVRLTGTFIPSTGEALANTGDEEVDDKNISCTLNEDNGYKLSFILFPQPKINAQLDAILTNSVNPNGIYYKVELNDLLLQAGKSYNYVVTAKKDSDDHITLEVSKGSITAWDEMDDIEIDSKPAPVQTNVGGTTANPWESSDKDDVQITPETLK